MRLALCAAIAPTILGGTSPAYGQPVRVGAATAPATPAPLPPGTPLGGPGRQTLGGLGAVRIADQPAPAPKPRPVLPGPFRAIADEIDRAADPS